MTIEQRLERIEKRQELIIKMLCKRPQSDEVKAEIKDAKIEQIKQRILNKKHSK